MQPFEYVILFFSICLLHGLLRAFYETGLEDAFKDFQGLFSIGFSRGGYIKSPTIVSAGLRSSEWAVPDKDEPIRVITNQNIQNQTIYFSGLTCNSIESRRSRYEHRRFLRSIQISPRRAAQTI